MIIRNIGLLLSALGDILIGVAVLAVHAKMYKEHKFDASVLRSLERERVLVYAGFVCVIVGFVLQALA